jgi:hypothetical protein
MFILWMDDDAIIWLCFCRCRFARPRGIGGGRADSLGASETVVGGRVTLEG